MPRGSEGGGVGACCALCAGRAGWAGVKTDDKTKDRCDMRRRSYMCVCVYCVSAQIREEFTEQQLSALLQTTEYSTRRGEEARYINMYD